MNSWKEEGIDEMVALLRNLRTIRTVTVIEGLWTYDNNRADRQYVEKEVDLDSLTWIET